MANESKFELKMQEVADAIRSKTGRSELIEINNYPSEIESIPTGSGGSESGMGYTPEEVYKNTRPSDWLKMPIPEDNEMYLLFFIPDGVSSLIAFTTTCTGEYTVELGTVENGNFVSKSSQSVASGTKYENELFADDYGNLTSDGFKQVMIKVSGSDITKWENSTHSKRTYPPGFLNWNIMEIVCKLSKGISIIFGKDTRYKTLEKLKYFTWYGENNCIDMNYMFTYCFSLVTILQLDTSNVTNMSYMFNACASLIAIPQLDTSNVTNMSGMFNDCSALIAIPQLDTSNVINMSGMFNSCRSLVTIPQLDTSNVTNMSSMFNGCFSLVTIPQLNTSNVTNISYMFSECFSLVTILQLDISNVTNISQIFSYAYSLTKLTLNPDIVNWRGISIDLSYCSLGHQALIDLFNSLPTITDSNNLYFSYNPGVSELTDEEKAIATNKNWVLNGV